MGLDLWIIYLVVACGCWMQFSFISEDKSRDAIMLRALTALVIPTSVVASLGAFGFIVESLS